MEQMLEDDELVYRLERGAKKLSQNFSWEKIAADYESALIGDCIAN
jgi:glycosyltransferase involved in cell wall biosynthesis